MQVRILSASLFFFLIPVTIYYIYAKKEIGLNKTILGVPNFKSMNREKLIFNHRSSLVSYAASILRDHSIAEDISQETFIRFLKQPDSKLGDSEKSAKAWMYRVCRNLCFDYLRKYKKESVQCPDFFLEYESKRGMNKAEIHDEFKNNICREFEYLNENEKKLIYMKIFNGCSYKEMEKETGLNEGNIGHILHMGLKKLRSLIGEL